MNGKQMSGAFGAILFAISLGLAMTSACSSSSSNTTTGTPTAGAAGASSTTNPTTMGSGGQSSTGGAGTSATGGAGGTGVPPTDGGSACSGETPAGTATCGAGKTCHLASCGPPLQFGCFPAGAMAQGAVCTSSADCAPGLTCIGYSATLKVCEKQCAVAGDCPNAQCLDYSTCSQMAVGHFCTRPCTDVTAAGAASCGNGFKCDGICSGQASSTICVAAGTLRSGTCMGGGDCAPGYTCINRSADGGVAGACTQLCKTQTDCTSGMCTGNLACGGMANGLHFCQ